MVEKMEKKEWSFSLGDRNFLVGMRATVQSLDSRILHSIARMSWTSTVGISLNPLKFSRFKEKNVNLARQIDVLRIGRLIFTLAGRENLRFSLKSKARLLPVNFHSEGYAFYVRRVYDWIAFVYCFIILRCVSYFDFNTAKY